MIGIRQELQSWWRHHSIWGQDALIYNTHVASNNDSGWLFITVRLMTLVIEEMAVTVEVVVSLYLLQ